jgi:hypothetical protein
MAKQQLKQLGETLKHNKTPEQLDAIADKIHERHEPENEDEKPYKLSLELPTWLVKQMKAYGKARGMTTKGVILVELLKTFNKE